MNRLKRTFINSLNHYRAIAVLFIIANHSYQISEIHFDTFFEKVLQNLIAGGTTHFVFISGFLFYSIFYSRFKYSVFVQKKFIRILIPYLGLSILPIAIHLYLSPYYWGGNFSGNYAGLNYFIAVVKYLISGSHLSAYWFIPFVFLIFLMSPFHVKFIELKCRQQILVLGVLGMVSIFIHRPIIRSSIYQGLHALIYFTPVYLLGIFCAVHKKIVYEFFEDKVLALFFMVLTLAIVQTKLGYQGNYVLDLNKFFLTDGVVDLIFIQKILMCLFFLVWLNKYEKNTNVFTNVLANFSFPIYFLHGYFLYFFRSIKSYWNLSIEYPWLTFFCLNLVLICFCIIVTIAIKKMFPKKVKYIVGYIPSK